MPRLILALLSFTLLAGCMSSGPTGAQPKSCDPREIESGRCVPGEYERE